MKGVFASHDFLRFGVVLLFAPITTSRHARHTNGRSWVVCSRVFAGVVSIGVYQGCINSAAVPGVHNVAALSLSKVRSSVVFIIVSSSN